MNVKLTAVLSLLAVGGCSMDGTTFDPSRLLVFDLSFPETVEPETVVDVRLWTQPCPEAALLPLSVAEFALARLDVGDPADRQRAASVEGETRFRRGQAGGDVRFLAACRYALLPTSSSASGPSSA